MFWVRRSPTAEGLDGAVLDAFYADCRARGEKIEAELQACVPAEQRGLRLVRVARDSPLAIPPPGLAPAPLCEASVEPPTHPSRLTCPQRLPRT